MQHFVDAVLWLRTHSIIPMALVFMAIAVTTYWPARRKIVEDNAMIPFRDDV